MNYNKTTAMGVILSEWTPQERLVAFNLGNQLWAGANPMQESETKRETKRGGWTAKEKSQLVDWVSSNPKKNGERYEAWLLPLCKILRRESNSVYQKFNKLRNANHS